ncbi:MAG TPA: hypothetical protein VNI01_08520 [Elusimicrobiota bacterium]|jgi:hypothetical protein|nr:hypothetical protein [Elusimicrobiota bacterium]
MKLSAILAAILAGAASARAANVPEKVPASEQAVSPQFLFPLNDPLQKDTLAADLKQAQVPSFIHIGGGRSAQADELRDSLALPKSRVATQEQPAAPAARPEPAKKPARLPSSRARRAKRAPASR